MKRVVRRRRRGRACLPQPCSLADNGQRRQHGAGSVNPGAVQGADRAPLDGPGRCPGRTFPGTSAAPSPALADAFSPEVCAEGSAPTWCERGDSNPHALRHWNLNPGRLPIPPLSRRRALWRRAVAASTFAWCHVRSPTRRATPWVAARCRVARKKKATRRTGWLLSWWAVKDSNLGEAAAHSRRSPTLCCAKRGPLSSAPTSPRLRRAPLTQGGFSPGHPRKACLDDRQEKSHPADRMAFVLVGCQGFEPWTY